ncbi:transglycosylase SLT domain-containing protein [Desulfurobacterium atlanticum]|uniref:Transglycosylase SLT domain-containing protein n=1 Tax=Desulfurobacterium atlanticum TaxID=240169 RepID=A0A238ZJP7_9BACT|nr:transglycosylase SLT domain-containing protein [Desulfurobacterium atlanticum]SNR83281.1 Transglycosylase SLT domain-containing protein [Desulfurobacterium atlanticum]
MDKKLLLIIPLLFLLKKPEAKAAPSNGAAASLSPAPLTPANTGKSYLEKLLDGICKMESSCSSRWAYSYHPDGVSYGLYGLTRIAVKDVGMNWEDVKRSTRLQREAARRYLLKMYKIFKNWDLAIQAYHLGPGNVKKGKRAYTYLRKVKSYAGV